MRKFVPPALVAIAAWLVSTGSGEALNLCNCCATQQAEQCTAACARMTLAPGQCPAVVDYSPAKKRPASNPLYGMSLMEISLGEPTGAQLESWRRFLERYRRRAVSDYEIAAEKFRKGRLDKSALASARALLNKAMVNYNHGIRAYEVAVGRKPD
jgi:hypothetical protein